MISSCWLTALGAGENGTCAEDAISERDLWDIAECLRQIVNDKCGKHKCKDTRLVHKILHHQLINIQIIKMHSVDPQTTQTTQNEIQYQILPFIETAFF